MDTKPHISIQNLSVFFGTLQVLKDISIDIPDRRITVVILAPWARSRRGGGGSAERA